jgi:hypothetical protein
MPPGRGAGSPVRPGVLQAGDHDPLDGPQELFERADLLKDYEEKVRREIVRLERSLEGMEQRRRLRARARAVDEDMFAEGMSRRPVARSTLATTVGGPGAGGSTGTGSASGTGGVGGTSRTRNDDGPGPGEAGYGGDQHAAAPAGPPAGGDPAAVGSQGKDGVPSSAGQGGPLGESLGPGGGNGAGGGGFATSAPGATYSVEVLLRDLPGVLERMGRDERVGDPEKRLLTALRKHGELQRLADDLLRRSNDLRCRAAELRKQETR